MFRTRRVLPALPIAVLITSTLLLTACFTWPHGISPVNPRHGRQVRSGPLTLEWKPVSPKGAEQVRYQLAIYAKTDALVYQGNNLLEPRHVVTMSLPPGNYRWTVRPFYLRDGGWEEGKWNQRKYFYFAVFVFGWGGSLYEFNLPNAIEYQAPYAETAPTAEGLGQQESTFGSQDEPLELETLSSLEAPSESGEQLTRLPEPASSSEILVSKHGFARVEYDPMVWEKTSQLPQSSLDAEFTLRHVAGDAWAQIVTENTPMSMASLRQALLTGARDAAPDAEIVFEEERLVNGTQVLCLEMALTPDQAPLTYFGYYWAGDEGSVRVVTSTEWHRFLSIKGDATALLNGLVINEEQ